MRGNSLPFFSGMKQSGQCIELFGNLVKDLLAVQLKLHFAASRRRLMQGSRCSVWSKKQADLCEVGQLIRLS